MDMEYFSSLHKQDRELAFPESGQRQQILSPENCFNPLIIRFRLGNTNLKINASEENERYFYPLTALRKAIEARPVDLKTVLEALWVFYDDNYMLAEKLEFQDFLRFDGLFSGCSWFKSSNPKDFPQDLICREEHRPKKINMKVFLDEGKRPKDLLRRLFNGRQDYDTMEDSSKKYENPFSRILTGEFCSSEAKTIFNNAKDCLDDEEFEAQFGNVKGSKNKKRVANERKVGDFEIADYADFLPIPKGAQVIQTPLKNGAWGFANVLRGLRADDRTHDYCKSVRTIANKHLEKAGKHLVHCDKAREAYWTLESNRTLFKQRKRGRPKRS